MRLKNHSHFIMLGLLEQKRRGKRKKNNREKSEYSYESESESDTGSESDIEPAPPGMTLTFIRIHKHITRHTDNQFTFHLACTWSQSCSHTTRPARSPVCIQLGMLTIVFTYHLAFFSFFFFFPSLIMLFFTLEMPFTKQLDLVWLMPFCCCRGLVSWIT